MRSLKETVIRSDLRLGETAVGIISISYFTSKTIVFNVVFWVIMGCQVNSKAQYA